MSLPVIPVTMTAHLPFWSLSTRNLVAGHAGFLICHWLHLLMLALDWGSIARHRSSLA